MPDILHELRRDINALQGALGKLHPLGRHHHIPGTWLPQVVGLTTAGTTTYAAGKQVGAHERHGTLVLFTCYVSWTAATGTGHLAIANLPYVSSASAPGTAVAVAVENVTFTGVVQAQILPNASSVTFYQQVSGGAATPLAVQAAGTIIMTGKYVTDQAPFA